MTLATTILRLFLSATLLRAALHKLRDHKVFQAELGAYQLLPDALLFIATVLLIMVELITSISLIHLQSIIAPLLAAGLFVIYSVAMAINLLKGRTLIDCGCGGPFTAKKTISWSLVIRNLLLMLLAILCTTAQSFNTSSLNTLDVFIILAGTAALLLIYEAIEQAIANAQNYQRWQTQYAAKQGATH